jgi:hypothetical protein
MPYVRPSLRAYNLAQLTGIEHAAAEGVPAHTVSIRVMFDRILR